MFNFTFILGVNFRQKTVNLRPTTHKIMCVETFVLSFVLENGLSIEREDNEINVKINWNRNSESERKGKA